MQKTSISVAVVLMDTAPLYVMLFSVLFLKEKMTKIKIISVGMMIVGCVLVSGIIGNAKFDTVGILIGILSGISYGIYNILTKLAMRENLSAITLNMYSFLFMGAIAIAVCNPEGIFESAAKNPPITVPLLIGIGIFTFVLPYVLYALSMKELPATTVSSLSIIEPIAATVFSIFLFREIPDIFGFIGIAMIILSIFVIGKHAGE
jgi:drug/metabolite transporter (DMT)-like permease